MKPAVFEQRRAAESHLGALAQGSRSPVPLNALLHRLESGSPAAQHAGARLRAYFAADGFERTVGATEVNAALLSDVEPPPPGASRAHQLRARAELQPYLDGKKTVDAHAFAKLTGIGIDDAERDRLDGAVKAVAAKMGLDHQVGFADELRYMDMLAPFAFVGTVATWDRPNQPLYVGCGVKARDLDDLEILHLGHGGVPTGLEPMLEDFLTLNEDQRIQAILVHEHLELEGIRSGSANPHRSAIDGAPFTSLDIEPRVRAHLELYRRLDQSLFGAPP